MYCTVAELTESQQVEQIAIDFHPPAFSNEPPKASVEGTKVHDACVQTESQASAQLLTTTQPVSAGYPSVTTGQHYGNEYLDPSPILPYIISPDALEGLCACNM